MSDESSDGAAIVASRRKRILQLARETGRVSVDDLAEQLAVTPQTIRKDLNFLARRALLSRVHGGAVIASGVDNIAYDARRLIASGAKAAIGRAVAALVPNGASLFINIGTTTEAIAHELVRHRDLMVVTNNLNVVDILAGQPSIEVIAVGGRVRASDRAVIGTQAMEFIRGFKTDFALIGASALDPAGTLLDFDLDEVQVSRTIIANARAVILAIDSTKIGRAAPAKIAELSAIDFLVTDRLPEGFGETCTAAGVRVIETAR